MLHRVSKPEIYGVAKLRNNKVVSLIEKPKKFLSDFGGNWIIFLTIKLLSTLKNLNLQREVSQKLSIY